MHSKTHKRGFIRHLRQMSATTQRKMATAAKCNQTYEDGVDASARAEWIRTLQPGDVAWVAMIECIPEPAGKTKLRPLADLTATIAEIVIERRAVIEDGDTGIMSTDGAKWKRLLSGAMERIAKGRGLSKQRARAMQKRSAAAKRERGEIGVVEWWKSDRMERKRERWGAVWRDPKLTAVEAKAKLPEEIRSMWMARQIFGNRVPGREGMGGRGKRKPRR